MLQGLAKDVSSRLMCYVSHLLGHERGVSRMAGSLSTEPNLPEDSQQGFGLSRDMHKWW